VGLALIVALGFVASAPAQNANSSKEDGRTRTARVVELKSSDGTFLKATYFAAAQAGPGVVLLHQSNRDRKSWEGQAARLAAAGISALTLDLRGFADSGGKRSDFKSMPADVDAAFQFLVSQARVRPQAIGLVGAGWLGVTYAVEGARRHPDQV